MACNLEIEDRISELLAGWAELVSRKMFGGICYLIRGNMAFGLWQDYLIVRTGPEAAERFLQEDGITPFDVTGKAMKDWVMVDGSRWEDQNELERWLVLGRDFAMSLPGK